MKRVLRQFLGLSLVFVAVALVAACGGPVIAEQQPTGGSPLEGTFIDAEGTTVDGASISAERIGLYFSAIWCPPCRGFTPLLVDAYNELNADGKKFEVIFVSADRDDEAMQRYMVEYNMPWLAVPFDDDARTALPSDHQVRGIPRLVILDGEGNVVAQNAVSAVRTRGAAAFADW